MSGREGLPRGAGIGGPGGEIDRLAYNQVTKDLNTLTFALQSCDHILPTSPHKEVVMEREKAVAA